MVDPNVVSIVITGGEPLIREDLEEVGLALYRRGYPLGIVSNGLYLTDKRLQRLMVAGLHSITVTLDGLEDDHNWLRGHPENYARAMDAIRRLVHELELVWDVVTCVNHRNFLLLEELKLSLYRIGVRHWRLFTIFPVVRAVRHPDLQLTDEEFAGVLEFIKRTRKEGKMHVSYCCEGFWGNYEGEVRNHFFSCNAGLSVGSVLVDGSISACPSIRSDFHQGNIYKDNFMDVWEHRFQDFRNCEWMHKGLCADCDFFRYREGNGMHLRDDKGELLVCHLKKLHK